MTWRAVERSIQGQDAVICALGARDLKATMIRTEGTVNIIGAMKKGDVRRLFAVSAMGVGESWNDLSMFNKLLFAVFMKSTRKDHEAQEAAVKESGLDWTIIRPSGLREYTPHRCLPCRGTHRRQDFSHSTRGCG